MSHRDQSKMSSVSKDYQTLYFLRLTGLQTFILHWCKKLKVKASKCTTKITIKSYIFIQFKIQSLFLITYVKIEALFDKKKRQQKRNYYLLKCKFYQSLIGHSEICIKILLNTGNIRLKL